MGMTVMEFAYGRKWKRQLDQIKAVKLDCKKLRQECVDSKKKIEAELRDFHKL
jgi:hypothetical protein